MKIIFMSMIPKMIKYIAMMKISKTRILIMMKIQKMKNLTRMKISENLLIIKNGLILLLYLQAKIIL